MDRRDGGGQVVFEGVLGGFALSSVLTVLELERRSGLLELRHNGRRGRIWLREGAPVAAMVDHDVGADAVFQLLSWQRGQFRFRAGTALVQDRVDQIRSPLAHLLIEAARRQDELAA